MTLKQELEKIALSVPRIKEDRDYSMNETNLMRILMRWRESFSSNSNNSRV
jgi:hypothetical protein